MIPVSHLLSCKNSINELSSALTKEDIGYLVDLLGEKNNEIRYTAFLTLKERSIASADVYPHFDTFIDKLKNNNSYQRSIGSMLIAENVKWDTQNKLESALPDYLANCDDEKFITARQTIQSISVWLPLKEDLFKMITDKLISIDISSRKDSQQKLLLMDILKVLSEIHKIQPSDKIADFMLHSISGGYLDAKSIKLVNKMFE